MINKNKFKVSVIITVFNRKKIFLRAINSLLLQTYKNFETIIVDDGSTDGFENIIFPILKKCSNFKYIRHSNRHTALSLNTGLKIAGGEYITFLDSDDEYKKEHLEKRVKYLEKNKNIDILYSNAELIGTEENMYVPDARNKNKLIHLNNCIIGATFFGKKKVFDELIGFKNVYSYDSEFFRRAIEYYNVVKFEMPTYKYYRDSKDSVLTKLKSKISDKK